MTSESDSPQEVLTHYRRLALRLRRSLEAGAHPREAIPSLLRALMEAHALASKFEFQARRLRGRASALWEASGDPAFEENSAAIVSSITAVKRKVRDVVLELSKAAAESRAAWTATSIEATHKLEAIAKALQEGLGDALEHYKATEEAWGINDPEP